MNVSKRPEPGSFADKLGIDKPAEWMHDMIDRCYEMFQENPGDFTDLTIGVLGDKALIFAMLGVDKELVHTNKAFLPSGL
jgi:hypothetical protein